MNCRLRPPKVLAGVLAGALFLGLVPTGTAFANTVEVCADAPRGAFEDVDAASIHGENVDCIAAYGISVGVGGGNYDPSGSVRRGQMASFLVNFAEVAGDERYDLPDDPVFEDTATVTHRDNISIAAGIGITSGATATTYEPEAPVTRAQMASFVVQTLEATGVTFDAADADAFTDDDGSVHEPNIDRLAAMGIVNGVGAGSYDPTGLVTRAQMATFLAHSAGHLYDLGLWNAGPLPIEAPNVVSVSRSNQSAQDLIVVVWNEEVSLTGDVEQFEVYGPSNSSLATQGAAVAETAVDRFTIRLADTLDVDGTYWLRIPAEVVVDEDDRSNEEQVEAFVFTVDPSEDAGTGGGQDDGAIVPAFTGIAVDGNAVADDGSVVVTDSTPTITGTGSVETGSIDTVQYRIDGAGWSTADADDGAYDSKEETFNAVLPGLDDGPRSVELRAISDAGATSEIYAVQVVVGANDPTITSIVTDTATGQLVVTFSEPVHCPNTANARSAWDFGNHSTTDDGSQAAGTPDSVSQPSTLADTCYLGYADGIEDNDYGMLDYTSPAGAGDRVVDSTDAALGTALTQNVEDSVAPVLQSVSAQSLQNPDTVELGFSEPILCTSLGESDFEIAVNEGIAGGVITGFSCDGTTARPLVQMLDGTITAGDSVRVAIVSNVFDESQLNIVAHGSSGTAVSD